MKIGDTFKFKECDLIAELVGENAEIVDMQIQEYEKCRVYPVWTKMTCGECRGKIYSLREGETGLLPKGDGAQDASNKGGGKDNEDENN